MTAAGLALRLTGQVAGVIEMIGKLEVVFEDTDTTGAGVCHVA